MALTKAYLKGLDIPDEKIASIIEAHTESIDALKEQSAAFKEQRDEYKKTAEKYEAVKAELDSLKAKGDFEKKYNEEHAAFEKYKNEREERDTRIAKQSAYRELLVKAAVTEKRIPAILKVMDYSAIELDKDGQIKGADKLIEQIKTEWADFVISTRQEGASTKTPPENDGGTGITKEEIMKIKDPTARQKAIADNHELFGF